jgi:TetR/AcrR family transcriptional regulator of autoinduction and epiphytic fitness
VAPAPRRAARASLVVVPDPPAAAGSARGDGRTARALRTREAVAAALLDLLQEGELRPGARRIAARAGVSERTVFQHFEDLESLLATAADRQRDRIVRDLAPLPAEGPLPTRIEALVGARATLYERIAPVRRAALLQEPFSPAIAGRLDAMRRALRAEVRRVFAAELATRAPAERRALRDALGAATSWSLWEHLRRHAGLGPRQAARAMSRTVGALLEGREGRGGP